MSTFLSLPGRYFTSHISPGFWGFSLFCQNVGVGRWCSSVFLMSELISYCSHDPRFPHYGWNSPLPMDQLHWNPLRPILKALVVHRPCVLHRGECHPVSAISLCTRINRNSENTAGCAVSIWALHPFLPTCWMRSLWKVCSVSSTSASKPPE